MKVEKKTTEEKQKYEKYENNERIKKFLIGAIVAVCFGIYVWLHKTSEQPEEKMTIKQCVRKLRSEGVPDEVIVDNDMCVPEN